MTIIRNTFLQLDKKWTDVPASRPLVILAATVAIVALPLLLAMDLGRFLYRSLKNIPTADHHYFYSTEIFKSYQQQLQSYIAKEVAAQPSLASLEIVAWVQQPSENRVAYYQGFLSRLRAAVQKNDSPAFIERLCHWVYTGPRLLPATTQWLNQHIIHSPQKGAEEIRQNHKHLSSQSQFQGDVFPDYRPYDPSYLGDAPSHFFDLGSTQIIRTPAVTRDAERTFLGHLTKAAIVPEFEGFLRHCQKQGKTHLYINLMEPKGSEKLRIDALENLEKDHSPTLHLMTLSKDCSFYRQQGSFANQNQAIAFKETFIKEMFKENSPYHWPLQWDRISTEQMTRTAIDKVHAKYFANSPSLDRNQRLAFIELAYTEIIESAIRQYTPNTCNVSCRSCVDRGAANLSLLYAQTQPSLEHLTTIALAPAILAQNRTMFPHRMARLIPALTLITERPLK